MESVIIKPGVGRPVNQKPQVASDNQGDYGNKKTLTCDDQDVKMHFSP
ncbi:MAG: hypothetical protein JXD22_11285 [Sedimentisphaerales bacterium]|nr:hypothetical protein [Sedimentisphaerales bacterium]